jgi:hypothetical protein
MMYGGDDPVGAFLADTWEWDGTNWSMRSPAAGPPDKALHAIASESSAGRLVLFGGQQQFGGYWGTNDTWLHGNLVVAAAQVFGTACAGATWLPPGLVSGVPVLGQTISLDLTTTIVSAPSMIALATNTQVVSLGGGCTLYLAGVTAPLFTLTNAFGSARVTIPIRLDPALRGLTLYAQAGVVDPTGAFSGFSLTAGLRLVLGD